MKYFLTYDEFKKLGLVDYTEFQRFDAEMDYDDLESMYISGDDLKNTGLKAMWESCLYKHDFFDMDTIPPDYWSIMVAEAKALGGLVLEAVEEISPWIGQQYREGAKYIPIVDDWSRTFIDRHEDEKRS